MALSGDSTHRFHNKFMHSTEKTETKKKKTDTPKFRQTNLKSELIEKRMHGDFYLTLSLFVRLLYDFSGVYFTLRDRRIIS